MNSRGSPPPENNYFWTGQNAQLPVTYFQSDHLQLGTNRTGVGPMAFRVVDILAEFQRLLALEIRLKAEVALAIEQGVNRGGFAVYFLDPNGISLGLIQPPP